MHHIVSGLGTQLDVIYNLLLGTAGRITLISTAARRSRERSTNPASSSSRTSCRPIWHIIRTYFGNCPCGCVTRVADSHYLYADPDPAFHSVRIRIQLFIQFGSGSSFSFNSDPDPAFHLKKVPAPDPALRQSVGHLQPLDYRSFRAPFWASTLFSVPSCSNG